MEKAELTAVARHISIFLKSGKPIYNSEVPDTDGRKTRRRTQEFGKCYAFHAYATRSPRSFAFSVVIVNDEHTEPRFKRKHKG